MKEAQIFENWINNLSEGTWALPETPEQMEKLNQLMSSELIVGPDATNATEQLYDIVGDDELFDILNDLADKSQGRANCWDDSDVQRRLAELGIQTPQSTEAEPADVDQDTAPEVKEAGINDIRPGMQSSRTDPSPRPQVPRIPVSPFGTKPPTKESADLARMLEHAGVPLQEGVLNDDTRNTWDHLLDRFRHEVEQFKQGSDLDSDLYDALFDYYSQHGAMPYGVAKNKPGFPEAAQWISNRFAEDLGINENLISPMIMPVSEGSCNMTMEGAYCPEHGLAECGGMYEGVNDPDYRGGYYNEFDELEDLLSKSGMSQDDLMRQRFLASKYGLNTPADMAKLPALKKDAEAGYIARKGALDADLEKRNQQYMQDKLTDLEYQQDPVAFVKRRTQQLTPTAPTAPTLPTAPTAPTLPTTPDAPADVVATPGTDYSLPRAKLGSSPSTKLPNFRPEPAAEVPAALDQTDTRNQKSSMFQQLAQLRNRTRGAMAETSNDDPINSNSAMTGSYYEGKETPTQEGDALLARIKSLALLR